MEPQSQSKSTLPPSSKGVDSLEFVCGRAYTSSGVTQILSRTEIVPKLHNARYFIICLVGTALWRDLGGGSLIFGFNIRIEE